MIRCLLVLSLKVLINWVWFGVLEVCVNFWLVSVLRVFDLFVLEWLVNVILIFVLVGKCEMLGVLVIKDVVLYLIWDLSIGFFNFL